jgi:hypothetical protein
MTFIISPWFLFEGPTTTARIHTTSRPSLAPLHDVSFTIGTATSLEATSWTDVLFAPESIYGPISADTPEWLRTVVWSDFRLAVTLFVVAPLILLLWSAWECRPATIITTSKNPDVIEVGPDNKSSLAADATLRVISGYWQASALLLITVLLNITASPIGAVTGAVAQLMIYVSLNWWESLNQEAVGMTETTSRSSSSSSSSNNNNSKLTVATIGRFFGPWRTVTSWVAGVGVAIQVPFLPCSFQPMNQFVSNPYCAAWLEPPRAAAMLLKILSSSEDDAIDVASTSLFLPGLDSINNLAMVTLAIYVSYLVYYVALPLREIGRSGRAPRSTFTFIDGWKALGFLTDEAVNTEE